MTNYRIAPLNSDHEVMVGWDPMLNSFFLHVIDLTKGEDDEKRDILWIGCVPHEIYNPDVIVEKAKPYATIDSDMRTKLYMDAHADDEMVVEEETGISKTNGKVELTNEKL